MLSFSSDYNTGAHPKILQKIFDTNLEVLDGYGEDEYSKIAKDKIRNVIGLPDAEIEFLTGGTQTNQIVISTMLKDFEGVISATTGHIYTHEAGAIEYTGHKILTINHSEGKIKAKELNEYLNNFYKDENNVHSVFPGMVYITYPTEYGTIYKKEELENIYDVCKNFKIPLYIDGARLAYGLMCSEADMDIKDLAKLCDVFYIGGTKVGALCGEAIVFKKNFRPKNFVTSVKRRGGLLAKGRLVSVQFDALFSDGLYFEIGKYVNSMALKLKNVFINNGNTFYIDSPTNQQFLIMDNIMINKLRKEVDFRVFEKYDETHSVVRFVTSWSTNEGDIEALEKIIHL